jgi:hypothetical protein
MLDARLTVRSAPAVDHCLLDGELPFAVALWDRAACDASTPPSVVRLSEGPGRARSPELLEDAGFLDGDLSFAAFLLPCCGDFGWITSSTSLNDARRCNDPGTGDALLGGGESLKDARRGIALGAGEALMEGGDRGPAAGERGTPASAESEFG